MPNEVYSREAPVGGSPRHESALIFLHLPKTGGLSLLGLIESNTPAATRHHLSGTMEALVAFWRMPPADRERVRTLTGHMHFGLHRLLSVPARYITVVRDPVERALSYYHYVLRRPAHYHHALFTGSGASLESLVRDGRVGEIDNFQVRMLCANPGYTHWLPPGGCTRDMLDEAAANLSQHFAVVGVTERLDEAASLICRTFGWPETPIARANRSPSRPGANELPASLIDAIREANELDFELHALASAMFERQLASSPAVVAIASATARPAAPAAAS